MVRGKVALVVGNTGSPPHIFGAGRDTDNQHLNGSENPFQFISGLGSGQRWES